MSLRLSSSMPLLATTTTALGDTAPANSPETERRCLEGGTRMTTSAELTASAASENARTPAGNDTSGR